MLRLRVAFGAFGGTAMNTERWTSVAEASFMLGASPETVERWARVGFLRSSRGEDGAMRISRDQLDRIARNQNTGSRVMEFVDPVFDRLAS
jgi:hypothetical protein